MTRVKLLFLLAALLTGTHSVAQQYYTDLNDVPNPSWEILKNQIPNGVNSLGPAYGSTIDVKNNLVETGLYGASPMTDDIRIHTLCNSYINRGDFDKMTRWYQEDGNTQVFRLFDGEHNIRNSRTGAARIEAFSKKTWSTGQYHTWIGRYTIIKAQDCAIFQAKNNINDWSVAINLESDGDIVLNHRRGTDKVIATEMEGKSFDIKVKDNGHDYEVFLNGVSVGTGFYARPAGTTGFRWGMYTGPTNSKDAMVLVSGATVDPTDQVSNDKPVVTLINPTGNQIVNPGYSLMTEVGATDSDGTISQVELFIDGVFIRQEVSAPYTWGHATSPNPNECNGLAIGQHTFTFKATDNTGDTDETSFVLTVEDEGTPSTSVVHMTKRNAPGFAIDGNHGAAANQNVYLWSQDANQINQHWEEVGRGDGFYSYKKYNTNFCLDGGDGGAKGQNIALQLCDATNHNQHWKKINEGSDYFRFEKRNASNYSIDGNLGGADGQNLYMWTTGWSSGTPNQNQHWKLNYISIADEDGDGIADHIDACPGFDDAIDLNDNGIPDGCDMCQDHIVENNQETITTDQNAQITIQTNGTVMHTATVLYRAGESIELMPLFEVVQGGVFMTEIGGCL